MKELGFTSNGEHIVEMSRTEYAHFSRLCMAVENRSISAAIQAEGYVFRTGFDFSNTFEVIRAFYESRFRITELQVHLDAMKESLK